MKNLFVLFAILIAGCGGSEFPLASVGGTITFDGEPLEGAEVVFAPMQTADVIDVGPASVGVTDAEGRYLLKTVKGLPGAVVSTHKVSVSLGEVNEAAVAKIVDEAYKKNMSMSEREFLALERKARQSLTPEKTLPKPYNRHSVLRFEVTGATESADFDLKSDGSL